MLDAVVRIGAQSPRENRTGRAATYNNHVDTLLDSAGPWFGENIASGHPHLSFPPPELVLGPVGLRLQRRRRDLSYGHTGQRDRQ